MDANWPENFNSASYFIDRHVDESRGGQPAIIDRDGPHSYAALAALVAAVARDLAALDLTPGTRVVLALHDTIAFPAIFWGAIKAGLVPVPLNTLLETETYGFILRDSGAAALVVEENLHERFAPILAGQPHLRQVFVHRSGDGGRLDMATAKVRAIRTDPAPGSPDTVAFWLYSSGSTGRPKGVMHTHRNLVYTAQTYGRDVLQITPQDKVFSAAKLFFAYGLGNGMTFPFSIGACAVLLDERPTPETVRRTLETHRPTVFFGVPTLFAAMLADDALDGSPGLASLRVCVSAGEPLPKDIGQQWQRRFGTEILDGVGSTEMLHIYVSNRAGEVHYGTSGRPVPGYAVRLVDEKGAEVTDESHGEMLVRGGSAACGYWQNPAKTAAVFQDGWTRTGDIYCREADGYYRYCGRNDDMFKSGGNWVSPAEVEAALITHDKVLEAGVVGHADAAGNLKPRAFVVLRDPAAGSPALARELQAAVKRRLERWKYPRWIEFVPDLPKTATGKIQRYKLRQAAPP